MNKNCLAIFLKYPQKGKVKTRLAMSIGNDRALEIYKKMAAGAIKQGLKSKADLFVFFYPPGRELLMRQWLGNGCRYLPQRGRGLGARMKNCFKSVYRLGYGKAVLIGGDIPGLDTNIINSSFDGLKKNDAVIGPSKDGGYYLIGFTKKGFYPRIFDGMEWSTDTVFAGTIAGLKKNEMKAAIMPVLWDVDDIEGLQKSGI